MKLAVMQTWLPVVRGPRAAVCRAKCRPARHKPMLMQLHKAPSCSGHCQLSQAPRIMGLCTMQRPDQGLPVGWHQHRMKVLGALPGHAVPTRLAERQGTGRTSREEMPCSFLWGCRRRGSATPGRPRAPRTMWRRRSGSPAMLACTMASTPEPR